MRALALVAATMIIACGSPKVTTVYPEHVPADEPAPAASGDTETAATATPTTAPPSLDDDCAVLDERACMASGACTLVLLGADEPEPYVCRPAEGSCETGLAQSSTDFLATCAGRAGCEARPAACYCPCGDGDACDCECSGGSPPSCLPL